MSLLEPEPERKMVPFIPKLAAQLALVRFEYEMMEGLYKHRRKSFRRWMRKLKRLEREGRNAA